MSILKGIDPILKQFTVFDYEKLVVEIETLLNQLQLSQTTTTTTTSNTSAPISMGSSNGDTIQYVYMMIIIITAQCRYSFLLRSLFSKHIFLFLIMGIGATGVRVSDESKHYILPGHGYLTYIYIYIQ